MASNRIRSLSNARSARSSRQEPATSAHNSDIFFSTNALAGAARFHLARRARDVKTSVVKDAFVQKSGSTARRIMHGSPLVKWRV